MIRTGDAIWVGLRFDGLALEVMERHDHRPLAIIELGRIHVSDAPVIEPGMTASTAQALVADLIAMARRPDLEGHALQSLALWAYQYTPSVVLAADNTLLLEIGSCQRLHGDLAELIARMRAELEQRGHRVAIGLAHTPKAAWVLALQHPPFALCLGGRLDATRLQHQIASIPIDLLPVEPKVATRLHNMGIESLGRVLAFDAALLGRRFGADFIRYLQKLTGHLPDPQSYIELKPEFEHSAVFLDGVPDRQMLVFPMKRLLQSLTDYLVARQLHCRSVQWLFGDAHQICATMDVDLSRPHHAWKALLDVSQLKLDQVELPELVFNLTLFADQFVPAGAASQQLFEEDTAVEEGHALLDKLAGRLGADALHRLTTTESLWPEAASATLPVSSAGVIAAAPMGERPTWLLPKPEPLRERDRQLWWHKPLELLSGPERLESPPDRGDVRQRDYYIARETTGSICWVFRELDSGRWFIHGLFA
jgi:protein ImuB